MGKDPSKKGQCLQNRQGVANVRLNQITRCRKYYDLFYISGFGGKVAPFGVCHAGDRANYEGAGNIQCDMVREAGPSDGEIEGLWIDTPDDIREGVWSGAPGDFTEVLRHTAKATVFYDLFGQRKYLLQLYQALHPEGPPVAEGAIRIVTLKNIFLGEIYNDLGFMAGDQLIVLVEAQSTWSVNIVVRCLMYLTQSWHGYIKSTEQNVYKSKKIKLPKPEIYVIFTGKRKQRQEWITLSEEFFGGEAGAVEVKAKVLYGGSQPGDIIDQYVAFTKVYDAQVKKHGKTREAVLETIRICKDAGILKEYLGEREKEVVSIMMALFDEEYLLRTYVADEVNTAVRKARKEARREAREEARKEVEEVREEAKKEVEEAKKEVSEIRKEVDEAKKDTARKLLMDGISYEKAAKYSGLTLEMVKNLDTLCI